MVISIAICDDDKTINNCIEQYIMDSHAFSLGQIKIEAFLSGQELCKRLDSGKYFDLIFMDIEMDNIDGITTGQLLREKYTHDSTLLIYVSSHTKYHGKLFDVQPYQFIQKPINKDEFFGKLKSALKKIESGNEIYCYKKDREYFQIKKQDIVFLESKGNNVILYVSGSEPIMFRGTLKEELKKLTNSFFLQPHIAYVTNMNHVVKFQSTQLIMDNGSIVPISEHRAKQAKYTFLNFRGK